MAKATRDIQHNEEHYVAKMNFRSEKILQSQIDRLNKEKLLQVKSLNAQMRYYERKLQKINDRVLEVERLSQNSVDSGQRPPTREHFSKLSTDAVRQRHMTTGVGYSYIDQLLGTSKPLVSRPIRWGINPSASILQRESFKSISLDTDGASSKTFVTEIKGHPIYLRPREAVYIKRQKSNGLILPPIALNVNRGGAMRHKLKANAMPQDSSLLRETENGQENAINQDANSQLSPIPEGEIEETIQIPDGTKTDRNAIEWKEKRNNVTEDLVASEAFNKELMEPAVSIENSEPLLDEKLQTTESGLLLRAEGSEKFTRSSETLNTEGELGNEHSGSVNKANPLRCQLHSRRFSL